MLSLQFMRLWSFDEAVVRCHMPTHQVIQQIVAKSLLGLLGVYDTSDHRLINWVLGHMLSTFFVFIWDPCNLQASPAGPMSVHVAEAYSTCICFLRPHPPFPFPLPS